jgi:cyclophilin family peptidyl-prolyl cis-trans isomerase
MSAAVVCVLLSSTVVLAIPEIKVRHVLVRKKSVAEEALNEFLDRGAKREDFIQIARKYSLDHPTKGAGGDLGWNTPGKFVREFSNEAFGLEPGEFTFEPVRTEYGWHLIYVEDKRDTRDKQKVVRGAMGPEDPSDPKAVEAAIADAQKAGAEESGKAPPADDTVKKAATDIKPPQPVVDTKPVVTAVPTPEKPTVPKPASKPKAKLRLRKKELRVGLEAVGLKVASTTPIQLNLTVRNTGEEDLKIFHPSLLALGLKVRSDQAPNVPTADWGGIAEPESFVITLKSGEIVGRRLILDDYFTELTTNNRLWVSWDGAALITNLRARFADKIASIEGFGDAEQTVRMGGADLRREVTGLDGFLGRPYRKPEAPIAVWDRPRPDSEYYARLDVLGVPEPLWFKLDDMKNARSGSSYFADLALQGYYDGLSFYDIRADKALIGGCPRNDGTGMPNRPLANAVNSKKTKHVSGTLSLLTRRSSKGATREAGSIFFVCLGDSPKWDDKHLPIGQLVGGEAALKTLSTRPSAMIQTVSIVPAALAPSEISGVTVASSEPEASTDAPDTSPDAGTAANSDEPVILTKPRELPRVELQTTKGKVVVELYEDDAGNTVNSFVSLIEKNIFPGKDGGKELKILDRADGYYIRTGSPDNSQTGGAGYKLKSEVADNSRRHEKGTLSMCLEVGEDGQEIPNTASSQFFICLDAINFWDGRYTPFGKVIEGLDIVESLTAADSITSSRVLAKRNHPYAPKSRDGSEVK